MGAEEFLPKNDIRTMDPWHVIKQSAQALGIKLLSPKQNCKKCHGRGYTGIKHDSGEPLVCPCVFPKEAESDRELGLEEQYIKPRNRAERRARKNK